MEGTRRQSGIMSVVTDMTPGSGMLAVVQANPNIIDFLPTSPVIMYHVMHSRC
jgi:hypothetical protein